MIADRDKSHNHFFHPMRLIRQGGANHVKTLRPPGDYQVTTW
jgi:hypothetical protein